MSKFIDLTGQQFGLWLVVQRGPNQKGQTMFECRCECGNIAICSRKNLLSGGSKSCGCSHRRTGAAHPNWKGHGEIPYSYWYRLCYQAKTHQRKVDITIEDAWHQFEKQQGRCALTGLTISFGTRRLTRDCTASLDRIDSSKGYTIDNIQWLDKRIQRIKSDFPQTEFIEMCREVARHSRCVIGPTTKDIQSKIT